VQIECLPYEEVLKKFDRPQTLFYCDPPYFGRKLYNFNFVAQDFEKLANNLRRIRGKCIVSLNDVPEVRELFRGFRLREIALPYTAQRTPGKRYWELLITNFS
jgi:DNA adenine methylase